MAFINGLELECIGKVKEGGGGGFVNQGSRGVTTINRGGSIGGKRVAKQRFGKSESVKGKGAKDRGKNVGRYLRKHRLEQRFRQFKKAERSKRVGEQGENTIGKS